MTDRERGEAVPMSLDAHVAVQTVELRHVRESLDRIEGQLGNHVSVSSWEQRNGYVDGRFQQVEASITSLKDQQIEDRRASEAQRAPWWVVLGAGLGIVSAVVAVMALVIK